ncbi:unnamed protein product [Mytilus edulis]|uniref:Uncharacterized protein n=1 Tax=Mytilus edulis TaxID=6550 RepID=A0A8S3SBG3_MYTED|nr:unnamed protein product [Mytilus edulis]
MMFSNGWCTRSECHIMSSSLISTTNIEKKRIVHENVDRRDVDEAYSNLFQLIDSEVISKIGYKSAHDDQHKITSRKSKYKPYWNENLQEHWENACEQEKVWLKCKICGPKKKHLREHFVTARNDFDKLLRKEKRNYQLRQQKELFDLSKESNTRDFWPKIGKLGIAKDRRDKIPMEVRLPNGNISKDINVVYETWKNEYEHLFNTSDGEYDEGFLTFIQQQVDHDLVNNIENNSDTLNSDISYEDVEKSVYRAKLNKSTGSGSSPRSNFDFSCGNTVVKYDSKYRYLGMWIDEHLDWKFTVREVRKSASRALSALYTKFIACGGMDFDIYEKLYENLVQPVLLYGSSIWGISEHKQLETVQNRACRYFLGAFKNSTNLAVRGDMGWTTVKTKQNIEVMRLFFKLSNLEDDRIVRTIHETSKTKQRSWHSRVLALLRKSELNFLINLNITTKQKLRMAQDKLTAIDQEKWLIDVFDDKNSVNGNKLRTFRRSKHDVGMHLLAEKTTNIYNLAKPIKASTLHAKTLYLLYDHQKYWKILQSEFVINIMPSAPLLKCRTTGHRKHRLGTQHSTSSISSGDTTSNKKGNVTLLKSKSSSIRNFGARDNGGTDESPVAK